MFVCVCVDTGDEPMHHKQLAIKRVPRSHASKVIADIIICRSRDNVSKMYKKLEWVTRGLNKELCIKTDSRAHIHTICSKVNGLCICFRQVDVGGRNTPSPTLKRRATITNSMTSSSLTRNQRGGSLKIEDVSRHMAGVTLNDSQSSNRRASNPPNTAIYRTVSPLASHTQRSHSPSPQPVSPTRVETDTSSHPPHSSSIPLEATDGRCYTVEHRAIKVYWIVRFPGW